MEKILSKSKSRYFFGKKKSAKSLGISNSDPPATATEGNEGRGEGFGTASAQVTSPHVTSKRFPSGASAMMINGPRTQHTNSSPPFNAGLHTSLPIQPHGAPSTPARPSAHGAPPQSRFEVHISPTAFSPIVMPSSTPPRHTHNPSNLSPLDKQRGGLVFPSSNPSVNTKAEYPSRPVDLATHNRSQSSVSPAEASISRSRRRQGIPANFMDMGGPARRANNGQSLSLDRHTNSHPIQNESTSSLSDDLFVQPSASAPAASPLSTKNTNLTLPYLAPLRENATAPVASQPSVPSPLPRSNPSYNLVALTPSLSAASPPKSSEEAGSRSSPRSHRGALPCPPRNVESLLQRNVPPQAPPPASPREVPTATTVRHRHIMSPSVSSEVGIGYKGLAFPLPPSSEEGLAMSYSSSQSSLLSVASGRRAGDTPTTPKKSREGKEDHDLKTPRSSGSRGAGSGAREHNTGVSEGQASPTPGMGTVRRRREGKQDEPTASGTDTEGERDTNRNMRECVAKGLEDAPGVPTEEDGMASAAPARAASESVHTHRMTARTQPFPQPLELTKPLSFTPGPKTLHTMRSVTGLGERKQLHTSISHRDLSSNFHGAKAHGERVRTTTTAIPVRAGPTAPTQTQPDVHQPVPPSFPLPTPPNSSAALSSLAGEAKSSGIVSQPGQARPHAGRLPLGVGPRPSLDDVTNALRTQRVRFDELAGYVLDVAKRHAVEKDAYAGRVERLEGAVVKMEREIRGLRWLVLESAKARPAARAHAEADVGGGGGDGEKIDGAERRLRRSSTMPQLPALSPPGDRPRHARNRRDAIGLGLGFSPDSTLSSPSTLSSSPPPVRYLNATDIGERTPSMDEIIDKLMAVRQWEGADVRVSVVEGTEENALEGGNSKRIVFREV